MTADEFRFQRDREPVLRTEYAMEALRMFGAAGRWCPADRLVWYGDGADGHSAYQVVMLLRKEGAPIESRGMGWHEYRIKRDEMGGKE